MGAVRKAFAANLAYHRERLGLSQAQVAEVMGTSPSCIGHLERGEREPSLVTIEELSLALKVQAGELFVIRADDLSAVNTEGAELIVSEFCEAALLEVVGDTPLACPGGLGRDRVEEIDGNGWLTGCA